MEWKNVVGYEEIYEVSDTGLVKTAKGKTTNSIKHGKRVWKQRVLKNKTPNGRDVRVTLWKDKKPKDFLVHRLVAIAFLPVIEGKDCINHIDGNPRNNNVKNLEWCDHKENNNHAFDNDLMTSHVKIVLVHANTKESHYFRSMSKASEFLGCNHGYLSGQLKRGKSNVFDYEVFIQPKVVS